MVATSIEKIKLIDGSSLRKDLPAIDIGDVIKMKIKVKEADKVRTHPFEGTVIAKQGSGVRASFTVRKISFGEGVEKTFPIHSPVIESIKVVSKGNIKRAKLYYLRDRVGKAARVERDLQAQDKTAIPQPQEELQHQ